MIRGALSAGAAQRRRQGSGHFEHRVGDEDRFVEPLHPGHWVEAEFVEQQSRNRWNISMACVGLPERYRATMS